MSQPLPLLVESDPSPVLWQTGSPPWLLVVDHAGNAVPQQLDLGVSQTDLGDHIGIDIGIWPTCQMLAEQLGATLIGQAYSRLVIDCNRQPGTPPSVPVVSDRRPIPGNVGADPARRVQEIFELYHEKIAAELPRHRLLGAMHSFTRTLAGNRRTVDIGVIHGPDARLADAVIAGLAGSDLRVERNSPYQIDFKGDYTIPVHGRSGIPYVEIEICQDLIGTTDGQRRLANLLAAAFRSAEASIL